MAMAAVQTPLEVSCRHLDICNPAIEDTAVAERIKRICPPHTYSWILVRTMDHHFGTTPGIAEERARLIQFMPTNSQAAWNIICIIFQRTTVEVLFTNRAVQGLLGSADQNDIHSAQSAYWQNYSIKVYVSIGGNFSVEMQTERGRVTQKISGICTIL